MIKNIIILSILSIVASADVMSYYKNILKTLQYDKTYSLYKKANHISKNGVAYSRYANFTLDASFADTKAKTITTPFSTTDIAINDTFDLFGKSSYKVEELSLDLKAQKTILDLQKEQLFISIVEMLALYHKTDEQLSLHKVLFSEQENIYEKLKKLQISGAITTIDLLRFKNSLTILRTKIINEESQISKMKKQLNLYAPNDDIATLKIKELLYTKDEFISHNPSKKLNEIKVKKLNTQAKSSYDSYLPDVTAGVAYQQLNDPTGYGDNYSFNVGLHMPLNIGDFKQAEAIRVNTLRQKSKQVEYKIDRQNQYTLYYEDYISAKKQLAILSKSLDDYNKSEETIKIAFLRQFVDFNTYLQVLTQTLNIKEKIIEMKYQESKEITILNGISSGKIYE